MINIQSLTAQRRAPGVRAASSSKSVVLFDRDTWKIETKLRTEVVKMLRCVPMYRGFVPASILHRVGHVAPEDFAFCADSLDFVLDTSRMISTDSCWKAIGRTWKKYNSLNKSQLGEREFESLNCLRVVLVTAYAKFG